MPPGRHRAECKWINCYVEGFKLKIMSNKALKVSKAGEAADFLNGGSKLKAACSSAMKFWLSS